MCNQCLLTWFFEGYSFLVMSSSSRPARQATGNIAQQIDRAKNKKEVTAEELKDGYRGIGRMTMIPVHISVKKELVKFGPARVTAKPPDAKKMKYVMFVQPLNLPWYYKEIIIRLMVVPMRCVFIGRYCSSGHSSSMWCSSMRLCWCMWKVVDDGIVFKIFVCL